MKRWMPWTTLSAAALLAGAIALPAQADINAPINSAVNRSGNIVVSAGNAQSCGLVPSQPVEVIHVTEAFASLQFTLDSSSGATLWITGNGQNQCLYADSFSNGLIQLPGVWDQGTYSVYVGNRSAGNHSYQLTIAP